MFGRKKIAMVTAEFLGTGVLTLVVLAVSKSTLGLPYFVAIAAGLVLVAMSLAVGAVSGAHFNPAVTIGLWTTRKIKALPALVYIAAQMLGAGAAFMLYNYFAVQDLTSMDSKFETQILVAEALGVIGGPAWSRDFDDAAVVEGRLLRIEIRVGPHRNQLGRTDRVGVVRVGKVDGRSYRR